MIRFNEGSTLLYRVVRSKQDHRPHPPRACYITRCCCSWPLLLLPVVQGTSRTLTIAALDAMAGVFSDDLNLKIGDLFSRNLLPATCPPCARPLMLRRTIQEHKSMLARAPVHACATATRAQPLLLVRDPVHACARLTRAHAAPCATPTPEHTTPLKNHATSPVYFRNPKVPQSISTSNPPPL